MGAYSNRVIADGASYYWRLGEASGLTAVAAVGGANGTISGGVTLGQAGAIADGTTAMAFNGTDGKIVTVATVTLPVTVTVEMWVKLTSVTQRILLFIAGAEFGTLHPTGMLYLFAAASAVGTRSVADGQWHHIAYALTGSTCSFYVDGVLDVTVPHVRAAPTTGVANLGWNTVTTYFPGSLDDVAIYPRALTAAEVSAHYALGRTTEVTALGVYAERVIGDGASNYWRLNEASGATARDIVGAKDGTISGGVTLGQPSPLADGTSAMLFNGSTGKIVTAATVAVPAMWTLEAWLYASADATQRPFFQGQGSGDNFYIKRYSDTGGSLGVQVNFFGGGQSNLYTSNPISVGQWHHVVVVFAGGLTVDMYVDGIKQTMTGSLLKPIVASSLTVELGSASAWPQFWLGSLDEVAIYPRALSASEVGAHYALSTVPVPRDLNTGLYTYLLGIFGVSSVSPGLAYADRVRADGATNHWRLGETSGTTAVDAIGGATGTISGGVTLNQPSVMADGDKAMTFNGTTGQIALGTLSVPVNATIEAWVKVTTPSLYMALFSVRGAGTGDALLLGVTTAGGTLQMYADTPGGTGDGLRDVSTGAWHHLVYVLSAANCVTYLDGVVDATIVAPHPNATSRIAALGFDTGGFGFYWNGAVDDVAIYPRALTAAEIAAHYAAARPSSYADRVRADGATNHWRLGETSGTIAVDAIGGANGTISGGVSLGQPGAIADGTTAMLFDATGDYVSVPPSIAIGTGPFTLECWLKSALPMPGTPPFIIENSGGANGAGFAIVRSSGNTVDFKVANGTTNSSVTGVCPWDGQWHQVVGTLTRGTPDVLRLYVDGVLVQSGSPSANGWNLTSPLALLFGTYSGGQASPDFRYFGSLDDISIYPRALTANEIAAHYSLGRSGLSGGNDLTTLITRYLATLSGDMTARWKQMEKNAGF